MNNTIKPDRWVLVKLTHPETKEIFYKVLAGWRGSYLDGSSWRLNSGVTKIEFKDDYFYFYGHSGSVYKCRKDLIGVTSSSGACLQQLETNYKAVVLTKDEIKKLSRELSND